MDPVHDRGSMDPVHKSGPWTWSKVGFHEPLVHVLSSPVFFKNNFHNKTKKVCIKTRSPSASLPSITVKWPIITLAFPGFKPTQLCDPSDQRRLLS